MANPKLKAAAPIDEEDEDLDELVGDLDDDDEEAPRIRIKKPAAQDDEDDDLDDEDESEDEDETPAPAARKMPVAKPAKPVVVSPPPEDEDVSDVEFDKEAKKRKDAQKVNDYLERKRSEETLSVDEITELMMEGNTDKIMHELVQYCADISGIKMAKQLLREARDRAKARVTRIAGVVSVMLDELKEEDDSRGSHD